VKPNLFQYVRAETIEDAVVLLNELSDVGHLIAGGQSLVPTMALRMASPEVLIDISNVPEMATITQGDGILRIGAGARYADILASPVVAKSCPLLTKAIPHIAHEAIRNRGTIGGSLAHADPAAEMPGCMLALNAKIVVQSVRGQRSIPVEEFLQGTYLTALRDGEMIVSIEIPVISDGEYHLFQELTRRSGDYAMLGVAFVIAMDGATDGAEIKRARLAYFSVGDKALLANDAAAMLLGRTPTPEMLDDCATSAARELDCLGDLYNSAAMKRHLVKTLTRRVLGELLKEPS
jgi:carbon-monoxide dehydrogenase medium subunit